MSVFATSFATYYDSESSELSYDSYTNYYSASNSYPPNSDNTYEKESEESEEVLITPVTPPPPPPAPPVKAPLEDYEIEHPWGRLKKHKPKLYAMDNITVLEMTVGHKYTEFTYEKLLALAKETYMEVKTVLLKGPTVAIGQPILEDRAVVFYDEDDKIYQVTYQ